MNEQYLVNKYKTVSSFKQEMDQAYMNYHKIVNLAIYSNLEDMPENLFVKYPHSDQDIFFYYGFLQPTNTSASHTRRLAMHFLKDFNPKPYKLYSLVFFNNLTSSNDIYSTFKNIFHMLTLDHFSFLKQFIVVHTNFMLRASQFITFGTLNSYIKKKTVYIGNSKQLCQHLNITLEKFISFIPDQIYEHEKKHIPNYQKQPGQGNKKYLKISLSKQEEDQKAQFQSQITTIINAKQGTQILSIEDYDISQIGIPIALQALIFYFKSKPDGLLEQGLFRKSVSIDQQNQSLAELSKKNYDYLQELTNPHLIANLIKRFFSKLKVPIVPYEQFHKLMHDQGVKDKISLTSQVIHTLPKINLFSLIYLLRFLKQQVVPFSSSNKMTIQNLAICFSPCLLRSQKQSQADLIYAGKSVIVVRMLLDNFDQIFGQKEKVDTLFRMSIMQKQKSFRQTLIEYKNDKQQENNLNEIKEQKQSIIQKQKVQQPISQEQRLSNYKTNNIEINASKQLKSRIGLGQQQQ